MCKERIGEKPETILRTTCLTNGHGTLCQSRPTRRNMRITLRFRSSLSAESVLSYLYLLGAIWSVFSAPLSADIASQPVSIVMAEAPPTHRTLWLLHRHRRKTNGNIPRAQGSPQGPSSPAFHSNPQSSSASNVALSAADDLSGKWRGSGSGRGRGMPVAKQFFSQIIKKNAGSGSSRRADLALSRLAVLSGQQTGSSQGDNASLPLSSIPSSTHGTNPADNSEADDTSIPSAPAMAEGANSVSEDGKSSENTSIVSLHTVSERSSDAGTEGDVTHRTTRAVPREGRMHIISVDEFERMVDSECENAPDDIEVKVEGDIMLNKEDACAYVEDSLPLYKKKKKRRKKRKITPVASKRWDLRVPIPFMFDGSHDGPEQEEIRAAARHWESLTCVRFQEKQRYDGRKIVVFKKLDGCWSYIGRTTALNQTISIGTGCDGIGTIAHEIGHVLGFWHEQSRMDRSKFIRVYLDHVKFEKKSNFKDRSWQVITSMNIPYDPGSALHYGGKYFNTDGQFTIKTIDPFQQKVIGQRQDLSFYDVKLANLAYCNVTDRTIDGAKCNRDGYTDPKRPTQCRCPDGFGGKTCNTVAPSAAVDCGMGDLTSERGYISYYKHAGLPPNQKNSCNWFIRVPRGKIIVLEILTLDITWDQEKWLCQDYVEVRYRAHLSETGGRFCGTTLPSTPVYSYTNEMLILFRTFKGGGYGFTARYRTESCGGCADPIREEQHACYRKETEQCQESWEEEEYLKCSSFFGNVGEPCGLRHVRKQRNMTCHVDRPYCCQGFALENNKCVAVRPARAIQDSPSENYGAVTMPTMSLRQSTPKLGGSFESSDERTTWPWSGWSEWVCSKPSCGCGTATRTRTCLQPGHRSCGGQHSQTERRACSNRPCYCSVKAPTYYPCPGTHYFGRTNMCVGYTTQKKVCPQAEQQCCPGQSQIGSVCSPWK